MLNKIFEFIFNSNVNVLFLIFPSKIHKQLLAAINSYSSHSLEKIPKFLSEGYISLVKKS